MNFTGQSHPNSNSDHRHVSNQVSSTVGRPPPRPIGEPPTAGGRRVTSNNSYPYRSVSPVDYTFQRHSGPPFYTEYPSRGGYPPRYNHNSDRNSNSFNHINDTRRYIPGYSSRGAPHIRTDYNDRNTYSRRMSEPFQHNTRTVVMSQTYPAEETRERPKPGYRGNSRGFWPPIVHTRDQAPFRADRSLTRPPIDPPVAPSSSRLIVSGFSPEVTTHESQSENRQRRNSFTLSTVSNSSEPMERSSSPPSTLSPLKRPPADGQQSQTSSARLAGDRREVMKPKSSQMDKGKISKAPQTYGMTKALWDSAIPRKKKLSTTSGNSVMDSNDFLLPTGSGSDLSEDEPIPAATTPVGSRMKNRIIRESSSSSSSSPTDKSSSGGGLAAVRMLQLEELARKRVNIWTDKLIPADESNNLVHLMEVFTEMWKCPEERELICDEEEEGPLEDKVTSIRDEIQKKCMSIMAHLDKLSNDCSKDIGRNNTIEQLCQLEWSKPADFDLLLKEPSAEEHVVRFEPVSATVPVDFSDQITGQKERIGSQLFGDQTEKKDRSNITNSYDSLECLTGTTCRSLWTEVKLFYDDDDEDDDSEEDDDMAENENEDDANPESLSAEQSSASQSSEILPSKRSWQIITGDLVGKSAQRNGKTGTINSQKKIVSHQNMNNPEADIQRMIWGTRWLKNTAKNAESLPTFEDFRMTYVNSLSAAFSELELVKHNVFNRHHEWIQESLRNRSPIDDLFTNGSLPVFAAHHPELLCPAPSGWPWQGAGRWYVRDGKLDRLLLESLMTEFGIRDVNSATWDGSISSRGAAGNIAGSGIGSPSGVVAGRGSRSAVRGGLSGRTAVKGKGRDAQYKQVQRKAATDRSDPPREFLIKPDSQTILSAHNYSVRYERLSRREVIDLARLFKDDKKRAAQNRSGSVDSMNSETFYKELKPSLFHRSSGVATCQNLLGPSPEWSRSALVSFGIDIDLIQCLLPGLGFVNIENGGRKSLDQVEVEHKETFWTKDELISWIERYLTVGKDFKKIATAMHNKTVKQCVTFFYKFKHLLRLNASSVRLEKSTPYVKGPPATSTTIQDGVMSESQIFGGEDVSMVNSRNGDLLVSNQFNWHNIITASDPKRRRHQIGEVLSNQLFPIIDECLKYISWGIPGLERRHESAGFLYRDLSIAETILDCVSIIMTERRIQNPDLAAGFNGDAKSSPSIFKTEPSMESVLEQKKTTLLCSPVDIPVATNQSYFLPRNTKAVLTCAETVQLADEQQISQAIVSAILSSNVPDSGAEKDKYLDIVRQVGVFLRSGPSSSTAAAAAAESVDSGTGSEGFEESSQRVERALGLPEIQAVISSFDKPGASLPTTRDMYKAFLDSFKRVDE